MERSRFIPAQHLLVLTALGSGLVLSAATYQKKPYLVPSGTTGKMHVVFQTDAAPGSVQIGYGLTPAATDFIAAAPTQTHTAFVYRADLTSLQAGQRYFYKITMDGAETTGSFVAPRGSDKADLTFYAYGDTRTSLAAHNGVAKTLMADLNQDPAKRGTFVLHCGDWVATGSSELDWTNTFFNATSGPDVARMLANLPIYGAIGNHEGSSGLPILKKYFPYTFLPAAGFYYSFDYGPVHVAVVDSETVSYSSGSAQYNWLKSDLSASAAPVKVVMYHSPAYSAGGGHADNTTAKSQIVPLFEQYGVNLVICGDNHYYARIPVKGVQHITSGGGGAPLYTPVASTANLAKSASAYHYIRFEVMNNATLLRGTVIKSDGSTIETFDVNVTPVVDEAPKITQQPASQSVNEGTKATFSVSATGSPAPTYQWKKNGTDIAGATATSYTTPNTTPADSGASFTVTVTNRAGSVTSQAATLTVAPAPDVAPAITTQPTDVTIQVNQTATFRVAATGTPAPTYQWKLNGSDIAGATSTSYTTPVATLADNGAKYSVIVTNRAGSVTSREALLTVTDVPPPPSDVNLALKKSTSASSTYSGRPSSLAVDGVNTTRWSSKTLTASTKTQWLAVNLSTPQSVSRAKILWGATYFASAWSVQYLNSSNVWTTVWSTTNAAAGRWQEVTFPAVSASQWRVHMTANKLSNYTIYELQLFSK